MVFVGAVGAPPVGTLCATSQLGSGGSVLHHPFGAFRMLVGVVELSYQVVLSFACFFVMMIGRCTEAKRLLVVSILRHHRFRAIVRPVVCLEVAQHDWHPSSELHGSTSWWLVVFFGGFRFFCHLCFLVHLNRNVCVQRLRYHPADIRIYCSGCALATRSAVFDVLVGLTLHAVAWWYHHHFNVPCPVVTTLLGPRTACMCASAYFSCPPDWKQHLLVRVPRYHRHIVLRF